MLGRALPVCLLVLAVAGCGDPGPPAPLDYGGADGKAVADFVGLQFNEYKHSQPKLKKLFSGTPPADLKKYDAYDFNVTGRVTVAGDAATAQVRMKPEVGAAEPVTKEWEFVREGGAWKVKAAPLP